MNEWNKMLEINKMKKKLQLKIRNTDESKLNTQMDIYIQLYSPFGRIKIKYTISNILVNNLVSECCSCFLTLIFHKVV